MARAESFFHSFPRDKSLWNVRLGARILQGIFKNGLLLVPEIVKYPAEKHQDGNRRSRIITVQRRFCMTMIKRDQLPEHSRNFGPISIEFSPLTARKLGALPVIYLPQGVAEESKVTADRLGYFFAYRMTEVQKFLEDYLSLKREAAAGSNTKLNLLGNRDILELVFKRLDSKLECVEAAIGALQGISKLFYPTDRFKGSVEMVSNELYYYLQREWRIISDVVVEGVDIDTKLSDDEKSFIMSTSPVFFSEVIKLRSRRVSRIDACTTIRGVDGLPVRDLIESIYVPANWRDEDGIRSIVKEYKMSDRLRCIDMPIDNCPDQELPNCHEL